MTEKLTKSEQRQSALVEYEYSHAAWQRLVALSREVRIQGDELFTWARLPSDVRDDFRKAEKLVWDAIMASKERINELREEVLKD